MTAECEFQVSVPNRYRKLSETYGTKQIGGESRLLLLSIICATSRRTCFNETKAKPIICIFLHITLTGDNLNGNASKRL